MSRLPKGTFVFVCLLCVQLTLCRRSYPQQYPEAPATITAGARAEAHKLGVETYIEEIQKDGTTPLQALFYLVIINSEAVKDANAAGGQQANKPSEQNRLLLQEELAQNNLLAQTAHLNELQSSSIGNLFKANAWGSALAVTGTSMAFSGNSHVVTAGRGISVTGGSLSFVYAICSSPRVKCPKFFKSGPSKESTAVVAALQQNQRVLEQMENTTAQTPSHSGNLGELMDWVEGQAGKNIEKLKQLQATSNAQQALARQVGQP